MGLKPADTACETYKDCSFVALILTDRTNLINTVSAQSKTFALQLHIFSLQDVHDCYLDLFQTHLHFVSNNPTGLTYQVSFISSHNPSFRTVVPLPQDYYYYFFEFFLFYLIQISFVLTACYMFGLSTSIVVVKIKDDYA